MEYLRALSVRQPFAELIARRDKTLDVHSWGTRYRGPLVICAGRAWHEWGALAYGRLGARGVAVCLVELVDARPMRPSDEEAALCAFEPGAHVLVFAAPRRLPPVPLTGALRLFAPRPGELAALRRAAPGLLPPARRRAL